MESAKDPEITRQLISYRVQIEERAGTLTFSDYLKALSALQAVTDNLERTQAIFAGVISQARQLYKSSGWIKTELRFELQVEVAGDRAKWALAGVTAQQASDDSLDLYNERLHRFPSPP